MLEKTANTQLLMYMDQEMKTVLEQAIQFQKSDMRKKKKLAEAQVESLVINDLVVAQCNKIEFDWAASNVVASLADK